MAYLAHIIRWLNPCYMEIKPFVWLIYMVASIDNWESAKDGVVHINTMLCDLNSAQMTTSLNIVYHAKMDQVSENFIPIKVYCNLTPVI